MKSRSASRERKVTKSARARVRGSRTLTIGWRGHERGFCAELVVVGAAQIVSYVLNFVAIAKTARAPTQIGRHHHYGIHVWPIAMVTYGRVRVQSGSRFVARVAAAGQKAFHVEDGPCLVSSRCSQSTPDPADVCASVASEQRFSGAAALEPAFGCGDKSRTAEPQIPEEAIKQQPSQAGARFRS